jgi:hypothetical protein
MPTGIAIGIARRSPMRPLVTVACLVSLALGCQDLPHRPRGHDVQVVGAQGLSQVNPNDIAIAPVEVADADAVVPEQELRTAFQKALIERRYSPLALEEVDRHVIDAAYRAGELREDAVLQIVIDRWDTSLWNTSDQIDAAVSVRLLDARGTAGAPLWEAKLERILHAYEAPGGSTSTLPVLQRICDRFAGDLLAALPLRQAVPE